MACLGSAGCGVQVGPRHLLRHTKLSTGPCAGESRFCSLKTGWGRGKQSLLLSFGFFPFLGYKYEGVKFEKGNCGVSIMRSGRQLLVVEWV